MFLAEKWLLEAQNAVFSEENKSKAQFMGEIRKAAEIENLGLQKEAGRETRVIQ